VSGYDALYGRVKGFVSNHLFEGPPVSLNDPQVLRNLSESDVNKLIADTFKQAINALTVQDVGGARIEDRIRLRDMRPFRAQPRDYVLAPNSLQSKIVGEAGSDGFELRFAAFLRDAPDVAAFGKNYLAVGFKLDYVKTDGDLSNYVPDFFVKTDEGAVYVVETKGRAEIDLPRKMQRLRQWCIDATAASVAAGGPAYRFVYVDQAGFERHKPKTFAALTAGFLDHQEAA
jgi:type III restriction enzyme